MKEKKSSYFTATWKMLAAVLIGGIAGGVSVVIYELMKKGIDVGIRTINGTIQQYISGPDRDCRCYGSCW